MSALQRLQAFAAYHGATIQVVKTVPEPDDDYGQLFHAPFGLDSVIHWGRRWVYVSEKGLERHNAIGGLIHELGHTLASLKEPSRSDEGDFLGWEWQVAKKVRATESWLSSMSDYQIQLRDFITRDVPPNERKQAIQDRQTWDFCLLTRRDRLRCLQANVTAGKKNGTIRADGEPLALR